MAAGFRICHYRYLAFLRAEKYILRTNIGTFTALFALGWVYNRGITFLLLCSFCHSPFSNWLLPLLFNKEHLIPIIGSVRDNRSVYAIPVSLSSPWLRQIQALPASIRFNVSRQPGQFPPVFCHYCGLHFVFSAV